MNKISISNDPQLEENLKKKTMKVSIVEGTFGVFSSVIADNYIVPFALGINTSAFQIGLFTSLANLVSPIGQIVGSRKSENKSRKSIILLGILGQASIWPIYFIIALLFQFGFIQSILPWLLISFFLIYMFFGGIMTPPWFSVMGDIVPDNYRGRYFAKRNLITQSIAIINVILLSFLLDLFKVSNFLLVGFILIFIIGFLTRMISAYLFTKHYYPPYGFKKIDQYKTYQFIKDLPRSNFGKFTLFVGFLTFGQWIAKPFFSVYMLTQLNFNYSLFMFINLSSTFLGIFTFPLLGKFSDKFGNVKLLRLGAVIIPFLPFFWIIYQNPLQIFLGIQILSGLGWTAFNLAVSNFIYDNTTPKQRSKYIALYNSFIGLAVVLGGILGSIIIGFVSLNFMNIFHFVFLLSGIIRIIAVIALAPKIKEVRVVTKPIFNVKTLSIYKWLYDITLRYNPNKKRSNPKPSN